MKQRNVNVVHIVVPRAVQCVLLLPVACTFNIIPTFRTRTRTTTTALQSSVGDGPPPSNPPSGDNGGWDDFLNPNNKESENLQRAREYMSEESLPISFDNILEVENDGQLDTDFIENDDDNVEEDIVKDAEIEEDKPTSTELSMSMELLEKNQAEVLAKNPYMNVVSKLSPSDLISKFTSNAHPRVQNAVRATILGLIGSLPKMAFDTTTITTGERLASLMFQLQMTGYMFKNAEYRLTLSQSLGMTSPSPSLSKSSNLLLTGDADAVEEDPVDVAEDPLRGKVKGKIKVRYGGKPKSNATSSSKANDVVLDQDASSNDNESSEAFEMEVDAAAYMSELRTEVDMLRKELSMKRKSKEEALRKDLLTYIRTLPQQELKQLTNTISEDVLVAMKGLVNVVLSGIGDGQIGPATVTEQSGEAMAQLCMWQLVVGYNLRELEVREEMKNSLLLNGFNGTKEDGVNIHDEPDTFE